MDIECKEEQGFTTLLFKGRLDATSSPEAEETFRKLINSGSLFLLLDFSELDYISSAGLRVLLAAAKLLSGKNGRVALYRLRDNVRQVFEISGFLSIFPVVFDEAEAASLFASK